MLAQTITQETRELGVVFDDQDAHEPKIGAPPPPVIPGSGASCLLKR
jgi:hypothetical protein